MVLGSPTPTWSRKESPAHPHSDTAGEPENEEPEDPFMPTTREVAETLVGMRSRSNNHDRSHQVRYMPLVDDVRFLVLNNQ